MDNAVDDLPLSLPPADAAGELDLRPRTLRRWIAQLPLANLGWTSGSLYETLKLANHRPLSGSSRIDLLEALRPTFLYALIRLRKLFVFRQFPLPARDAEVRAFVIAMLGEVADGYRLALESPANAVNGLSPQQQALAIHRALRCLSGQVIESYRFYQTPPAGVWRDIHDLYNRAAQAGVQHLRVEDDGLTGRGRCTIRRAYKQILLLAAMDPASLRHQEIDGLFAGLKKVAARVEVRPVQTGAPASAGFVIEPQQDNGPTRGGVQPSRDALLLDCHRFLSAAESGGVHSRTGWTRGRKRRSTQLAPQLVRQVRERLGRPTSPRPPRTAHEAELEVLVGLGRISQTLLAWRQMPVADDPPALDAADFRWEFDELEGLRLRPSTSEARTPSAAEEAPPPLRLAIGNVSPRGYCLRLRAAEPQSFRVGDPLLVLQPGLRGTRDERHWRFGWVRWLSCEAESLRLGVEILPCWAAPVQLQRPTARPEDKPFPGLLLLSSAAQARPTLLAPQLHLAAGNGLVLSQGGADMSIRLATEIDRTGACQRFEFQPLGEDEQKAPQEGDQEEDFRRLYSVL